MILLIAAAGPVSALDIEGVQNVSIDQPQVYAAVSLGGSPTDPLTASDGQGTTSFTIRAFYDTGASGVLISRETALGLGIPLDDGVTFEDVGVGGADAFDVSQAINVHLAPYGYDDTDLDNPLTFTQVYDKSFGPLRAQVSQVESDIFVGGLDVLGMPTFQNKTAVFDVRPMNDWLQGIGDVVGLQTRVYESGQAPTDLPAAHYHIQTSYGDFSRFTRTFDELGQPAIPPALSDNPFVGVNPVNLLPGGPGAQPDDPPGIEVGFNGLSATGSWLFDTGAQLSILSREQAAQLGVTYAEGTYGSEDPILEGVSTDLQFGATVGGVGGQAAVRGFFLDSMTLPTVEGEGLNFIGAPVLVADISLQDPNTGDVLTLDGVLGMNYFMPSAFVDGFSFGDFIGGAFDVVSFDQPSGVVSLVVNALDPVVRGDMDHNGVAELNDALAFVLAITSPDDYQSLYGTAGVVGGDFTNDGVLNFDDVMPFAQWLDLTEAQTQSLLAAVPEPGVGALLAAAVVTVGLRERRQRVDTL